MRWLALVACVHGHPVHELRIDAMRTHDGAPIARFAVRGTTMTIDARQIALTDAQVATLAADATALLPGAHIARAPWGTSHETWTIHVEVDGKSADCNYVNPTDDDPLYTEAGNLLADLDDLTPR